MTQGDHILVLNADSRNVDIDLECDVGQVLHMYENLDPKSDEDPCRAVVRWYSRPNSIKKYTKGGLDLDADKEVVLDSRPFDNDISLEAISKLCTVTEAEIVKNPSELCLEAKKRGKMPFYVCRYKLVKRSSKYVLVPLLGEIRNDAEAKTPKSSKKSRSVVSSLKKSELSASKRKLVSPIKITKNGVERISRNSDEENVTPNKRRMTEINGNYLEASPKSSPISSLHARRNLNDSLNNEANLTGGSDILNYSIVKTPNTKELNICLRVSQRIRTPKKDDTFDYTPSIRKRSKSHLVETSPVRERRSEKHVPTPTSRIQLRRASTIDQTKTTPTAKLLAKRRSSVHTPSAAVIHPRRSILKTPNKSGVETPKKRLTLSNIVEEVNVEGKVTRTPRRNCKTTSIGYYCEPSPNTPPEKSSSSSTRTPKSSMTPSSAKKLKQIRSGEITPSIHNREKPVNKRRSELEMARESLHVSAVLKSLPCRENEFNNIYSFVEGKLFDKCGGCMYISGKRLAICNHFRITELWVFRCSRYRENSHCNSSNQIFANQCRE